MRVQFTKSAIHTLTPLALTAALLYVVFANYTLDQFTQILKSCDLKLFSYFVILSLTGLLARALRYLVLVNSIPQTTTVARVPFGIMVLITGVRNAVVDLLPARLGELAYVYLLNRCRYSLAVGVGTLGFCFVLDLLVLALMLGGLLIWSPGFQSFLFPGGSASATQWPLFVGLALIIFLLGALVYFMPRILLGVAELISQVRGRSERLQKLVQLAKETAIVFKHGRSLTLVTLLLTVVLRGAKYLGLYLLMLSFVHQWGVEPGEMHPLAVVVAFVGAEAAASLPVSGLMGFGLYEGVWSMIFSNACAGISCENVPVVVLAFSIHLVTQLVGYSIGIVALLLFLWQFSGERTNPIGD